MLKRCVESRRRAVLVLPYIAVGREKLLSLQRVFRSAGVRVCLLRRRSIERENLG